MNVIKFVLIKPSFACFLFTFELKDLLFSLDDLQPSDHELVMSSSVTYTLIIINERNVKQQKRWLTNT